MRGLRQFMRSTMNFVTISTLVLVSKLISTVVMVEEEEEEKDAGSNGEFHKHRLARIGLPIKGNSYTIGIEGDEKIVQGLLSDGFPKHMNFADASLTKTENGTENDETPEEEVKEEDEKSLHGAKSHQVKSVSISNPFGTPSKKQSYEEYDRLEEEAYANEGSNERLEEEALSNEGIKIGSSENNGEGRSTNEMSFSISKPVSDIHRDDALENPHTVKNEEVNRQMMIANDNTLHNLKDHAYVGDILPKLKQNDGTARVFKEASSDDQSIQELLKSFQKDDIDENILHHGKHGNFMVLKKTRENQRQ